MRSKSSMTSTTSPPSRSCGAAWSRSRRRSTLRTARPTLGGTGDMPDDLSQVVTYDPDGTDPRWLGHYGYVTDLGYSFALPGGCDQMSCTLATPASWRNEVLNPGRLVRVTRGGTTAWAGILDEPQPGDSGWQVTAHGAGGYGDDYLAIWTGSWGTGVFNNAIDAAISRGLDWTRAQDIGATANIWTGQQVDSGGQTITDLLNLGAHKGGLTWAVQTTARGNIVSVFALPTAANRILSTANPEGRSIADAPTTVYVRYQATWDTNTVPATYATTSVTSSAREAAQGRSEDLMDISSAGVYPAGAAQAVATSAMKRFTRAAFADPFHIQPGQLLTLGGQACDLGLFWADGITAMVCKLILADYAYGGEV